jgi:aminoglycoside phosphotransferase (APT) family kinase protein
VKTSQGFDLEAVGEWLARLGQAPDPPLRARRLGQGHSNLTYLVTDASGRRWVLRRPPFGELLETAHDMAREHRILSALHATAVPTPAALGFVDDALIADAPLVLMSHVDGITVNDVPTAESLGLAARRTLGAELPRTLAKVHAVDLDAVGLRDLASTKPYAARQLKRWRRQWESSRTRELGGVTEMADRLAAAMPAEEEVTLVHGDFHLLNVMVDPAEGVIRAVLDWELCTLGDPLADVGGMLAYWPEQRDEESHAPMVSALRGFPTREELLGTYAAETGRDVSAVGFWFALALWKIAIIIEGVRQRALDDGRNGASASAPPAALVDSLLRRAAAVAPA